MNWQRISISVLKMEANTFLTAEKWSDICYSVNLPPKITRFSLSFGSWASVCWQCAAKWYDKCYKNATNSHFSNTSHKMWCHSSSVDTSLSVALDTMSNCFENFSRFSFHFIPLHLVLRGVYESFGICGVWFHQWNSTWKCSRTITLWVLYINDPTVAVKLEYTSVRRWYKGIPKGSLKGGRTFDIERPRCTECTDKCP